MLKYRLPIPLIYSPSSVPFSPSSGWASAVAASDSIRSARTMSGFGLVGDSSGQKSSLLLAKKFWVEGKIRRLEGVTFSIISL